jgi:cytochrome c
MDGFEINKIVGAILTASVIALLSGFVAEVIFEEDHGEAVAYSLAPSEAGESMAAEAAPSQEMIGPLLAAADAGSGKSVAKKCTACHTLNDGGANKIGPNLWDIVTRAVASHAGYSFSSALQGKSGETWTYENLNAFLLKSKSWAPGTKMGFAGIKKPQDRANLILYLRSLSGNPPALPEG